MTDLPPHPIKLVAGSHHTCALDAGGHVTCIGALATSAGEERIDDPGDPLVDLDSASTGVCGVRKSGAVACRGGNPLNPTPYDVLAGLPPSEAVSIGFRRGCVLTREHEAWCFTWPGAAAKPERVASEVLAVRTSGFVTCVLRRGRTLSCRGKSDHKLLGDVAESTDWMFVAEGVRSFSLADHACFVSDAGLFCWGWNHYGQVGDGTREDRGAPTRVKTDETFTSVEAGAMRTCGRTTRGSVVCWGLRAADDIVKNSSERLAPFTVGGLQR